MTVAEKIEKYKIIAIIRGIHGESLLKTVQAFYDGGIRLAEVTFDSSASSARTTTEEITELCAFFKDKMEIGAGTVLTCEQVKAAAQAGATFLVSPNVDEEVIKYTKQCALTSIPGAFTPSEIAAAHKFGADYVKLFPAGELGISYAKALRGPFSGIKMLAFGGIDSENISDYMDAGFYGAGIGACITPMEAIKDGDFAAVVKNVRKIVTAVETGKIQTS